MNQSGIYELRNTANGKRYIGSAVNIKRRQNNHRSRLRRGEHRNDILQRSWLKHGEAAFKFSVLLICDKSMLLFYEQRAIDAFRPEYNIEKIAGSPLGTVRSPAACARISAALMGHYGWTTGKTLSPETRAKISAAAMGNTRALGHKHSAESIEKMSAAKIGKKKSAEARANMSAARRGIKLSPEHRAKISASLIGNRRAARAR